MIYKKRQSIKIQVISLNSDTVNSDIT
jgi:hypothetical protein